jgi:hypothetical protein
MSILNLLVIYRINIHVIIFVKEAIYIRDVEFF